MKQHKIVLAMNTTEVLAQQRVVDSVTRLKNYFGSDTLIEIVAYGPGLVFITQKSAHQIALQELAVLSDVTLSACANTISKIEKKTGLKPQLLSSAQIVPGGLVRIVELQEQNYAYLLP